MRVLLQVTARTPATPTLRQRCSYHATTIHDPRLRLDPAFTNHQPSDKQEQIQARLLLRIPATMPAFATAQANASARPGRALVTGAGIAVALGAASAVLYTRMLKARAAAAAAAAAATDTANAAQQTKVSNQQQKTEETGGSKQPCEGCDCGLNGAAEPPGPLEGTMHAYESHIIICSGHEDWPKMIEAEEASIAQSLHNMCLGAGLIWTKQLAKAAAAEGKVAAPNRVKISACTEPSRGRPGYTDVIVYPEGLVYSLDPNDLDALQTFVKVQLADRKVATELKPVPVSYEKMVLVCTHASRDKRCGRAGPQVLEAMAKELESRGIREDQVAIRGSSHFGGHKYAGVLIIYPQGDWYGLVNKKNAACIIDKVVLGTSMMKANWRGNMSNPGRKAEPVPVPVPAANLQPPPSVGPPVATPKVGTNGVLVSDVEVSNGKVGESEKVSVTRSDDSAAGGHTVNGVNGVTKSINGVAKSVNGAVNGVTNGMNGGNGAPANGVNVVERTRRESFDSGCVEGA